MGNSFLLLRVATLVYVSQDLECVGQTEGSEYGVGDHTTSSKVVCIKVYRSTLTHSFICTTTRYYRNKLKIRALLYFFM